MPGGQFEVVADALRQHANAVEAIADHIETARAAGAQVRLGRGAYGMLPVCQMISMLLDPIQQRGVDALAAARDALHGSADAVRTAATRYDATDAAARARLAP
ncbi:ESX-1 secretion-associated protein [Planosporangium thailandense]|uniref:ESX-1 secretion-associated protein n=1 Tax=Planosporangium thailandense TaxID=765197 RepID=A0ABX0Y0G7_9ACTN|nr:ESX-1 secretion-associated protein [Planosporangium thailandense]